MNDDDATRLPRRCSLRDGGDALMRVLRPDDIGKVVAAFHQLEPESVFRRFHAAKSELNAADLERLASNDLVRVIVLVVTRERDGDEVLMGGASCFIGEGETGAPLRAEISFTVEEDYHGLGIAGVLLDTLAALARERGVDCLQAEVLTDNIAMLRVFERSALPLSKTRQGGVVHVEMALGDVPC
jgi:GNAT superfamily N-acetyltransferase